MDVHLTATDEELIAGLKGGDVFAFNALYKKYSGKIYVKINKMLKDGEAVEELIQVLFLKIWNHREQLSYDCDLSAYLYRSAANLVCDFYRKEKRDKILFDNLKVDIVEEYSHIEEGVFLKESEQLLQRALAILTPQQRHVFKLCKLEGYTYKETASELGISPYTVKEYLCVAKSQVKDYITKRL